MAHLKQLHLGDNLEDLQKHCIIPDVRNRSLKMLLNTAKRLYQTAEEQRMEGDEELAYVAYMKYFNLLSCIHKKPEYAQQKLVVRQMLGDNEANRRIMDKLERLSDSLSHRYINYSSSKMENSLPKSITTLQQSVNTKNEPEKSIKPSKSDFSRMGLISCERLFELTNQKNVLIMDCRPRSDYENSHLTYGWSFNVPEELVSAGMSAGKLQGRLSSADKAMWAARAIKDHVVLMDWTTKDAEPAANTTIAILLDILKNWDPDVTYRSPIQILEGGYAYFIMMYPTYCTNPIVQAPQQNNNVIETIDDIEYPSIHDITMKDELRDRDFSLSPDKSALQFNSSRNVNRPSIDRASKKAALRTYEDRKPISEIMQEHAELVQKAEMNDEMLENASKEWQMMMHSNKDSATNTTVIEQELRYNIMQLENAAKDYRIENKRLREELNHFKQQQEEAYRQPLSPKEVEVTKQIETKILEREILDAQHERERIERERLLSIAREAKRNYKPATTPEDSLPSPMPAMKSQPTMPDNDEQMMNGESQKQEQQKQRIDNDNYYSDEDEYVNKENIIAPPTASKPEFNRAMKPQNLNNINYNLPAKQASHKQRDFSPVPSANVGRGLTGLKNLGNTCYMNSILQCLSNTPQLTEYCITDKYKDYISRNNKTKGHIVEEVAALIKILWNGNYKCVASKDLRYAIGQYQKIFRGVEQQDSHEFLTILMDWLHSDLQTLHVPRMRENISASEKAWLEFTKSKESLILHLFYGQIKSTVKCVSCHKESATYECFSNLSLELPSSSSVCYLSQCMDMYFSGELIHGWNCPSCKQKRDAIKKMDISKLPPVLVVHLKRFYADTDGSGNSYKKKQDYLRFPLENLDMTPYIAKAESRSETPKTYQLYGVSNHYGSMESGHYTAFCKSTNYNRWFKYDDQIVTPLDTSNVVSSAAYILFYTWLPPIQISECN